MLASYYWLLDNVLCVCSYIAMYNHNLNVVAENAPVTSTSGSHSDDDDDDSAPTIAIGVIAGIAIIALIVIGIILAAVCLR